MRSNDDPLWVILILAVYMAGVLTGMITTRFALQPQEEKSLYEQCMEQTEKPKYCRELAEEVEE
jgi:hypothetical protein